MIRVGGSRRTKREEGLAPYTRDIVVNPISKGLCRAKIHTL